MRIVSLDANGRPILDNGDTIDNIMSITTRRSGDWGEYTEVDLRVRISDYDLMRYSEARRPIHINPPLEVDSMIFRSERDIELFFRDRIRRNPEAERQLLDEARRQRDLFRQSRRPTSVRYPYEITPNGPIRVDLEGGEATVDPEEHTITVTQDDESDGVTIADLYERISNYFTRRHTETSEDSSAATANTDDADAFSGFAGATWRSIGNNYATVTVGDTNAYTTIAGGGGGSGGSGWGGGGGAGMTTRWWPETTPGDTEPNLEAAEAATPEGMDIIIEDGELL